MSSAKPPSIGATRTADSVLLQGAGEGRPLYEHEVYALLEDIGGIRPPVHFFIPTGSYPRRSQLDQISSDRVVLKLVSRDVVHKSDVGAVRVLPKEDGSLIRAIDELLEMAANQAVAGFLIVEYIEHGAPAVGSELLVGIRSSRELGPAVIVGVGGADTEFLNAGLRPELALAQAAVFDSTPEDFLREFRKTVGYQLLSGQVRGHRELTNDAELLRVFRAFYRIARTYLVSRHGEGPEIASLEINPFGFVDGRAIPLDGRASLGRLPKASPPRDQNVIDRLLRPGALAFIGISSKALNPARIALQNTLDAGFPPDNIVAIHPSAREIDGIACVKEMCELPSIVDALVVGVPAKSLSQVVEEAARSRRVRSAILLTGGVNSSDMDRLIRVKKDLAILGPNGMGIRSTSAKLDTFFIPRDKLSGALVDRVLPAAIVSQSGAFVVSRLSRMSPWSPALSVSLGNQCDVSVADVLAYLVSNEEIAAVGVYLEGLPDLDGLPMLSAIRQLRSRGKEVIVMKAGLTAAGESAAFGHTGAMAGDPDLLVAALEQAGAWIVKSVEEFDLTLDFCARLGPRPGRDGRILAITNAGMEAVGIADIAAYPFRSLGWLKENVELAVELTARIEEAELSALVSTENPLDLTPMASEDAYEKVVQWGLGNSSVDAIFVSCVPLAADLRTASGHWKAPGAFPGRVRKWWKESDKPLVFCIDAGHDFDALAESIREHGIPVARYAPSAFKVLERWLERRQGQGAACQES